MSAATLHTLHRWGAMLTTAFLLFYSLSGLILNHRQAFAYFQTSQTEQRAVPQGSLTPINSFIDQYRELIGRDEAPSVIRIKDGKIVELLYGSHGQTTYTIDPGAGTMKVENKSPSQPLFLFNKLHKAAKTGPLWLLASDVLCLALILASLAILATTRYRKVDLCLLATGFLLCLGGALLG